MTPLADNGIREVIVIGSGPAGYTAAVYTARAELKPLVFGGAIFVGGALTTATEVENFPGFPEGIDGPDLMANMRAQAEGFGAEIIEDDIVEVDLTGDIKTVTDGTGTVHRAKTVIVATGSGYRKLGLPGEEELSGRGVSWCATCDGFFFRDHAIVVVGGGDTASREPAALLGTRNRPCPTGHRAACTAPGRSPCAIQPRPTGHPARCHPRGPDRRDASGPRRGPAAVPAGGSPAPLPAVTTGPGAGANLATLVAQVADSVARTADILAYRCISAGPGAAPAVPSHRAVLLAHPQDPAPKGREGLAPAQSAACSPETQGAFSLSRVTLCAALASWSRREDHQRAAGPVTLICSSCAKSSLQSATASCGRWSGLLKRSACDPGDCGRQGSDPAAQALELQEARGGADDRFPAIGAAGDGAVGTLAPGCAFDLLVLQDDEGGAGIGRRWSGGYCGDCGGGRTGERGRGCQHGCSDRSTSG